MSANIKITSDEQAKEVFEQIKKYYENQNPNARCYLNYYVYEGEKKKKMNESLKNKYHNDPEYRARKNETSRIFNEKKKLERKKKKKKIQKILKNLKPVNKFKLYKDNEIL